MFTKRIFIITLILAALFSQLAVASQEVTGSVWSSITVSGHVGERRFPYLFEVHGRFFNDCELYERSKLRFGIGTRSGARASWWAGYDIVPIKIPGTARFDVQQRTWQQFFWFGPLTKIFDLTVRTRLEQRFSSDSSQVAWRIRQKATLILARSRHLGMTLRATEELHFNLNHPHWIGNKVVNQNRFGIISSFHISENAWAEVGYIHQLKFREPNDRTIHILEMALNFHTD